MFSFFKKQIHEPVANQRNDLNQEPIGHLALAGEDCDQVSGAAGPFGQSYKNPIPVNGLLGTYKYFSKLIAPTGDIVYFHRLGSLAADQNTQAVDAYEVVDRSGRFWDLLFIEMYHPRRSNLAPATYKLKSYDPSIGDLPFAFGVDIYCPKFPHDLGDAIEGHNGLAAFARKVRAAVEAHSHQRPEHQTLKIASIQPRIAGTRVWSAP